MTIPRERYGNKAYIEARNKLIPFAVACADRIMGKAPSRSQGNQPQLYADQWNEIYFWEMNRLAKLEGLC